MNRKMTSIFLKVLKSSDAGYCKDVWADSVSIELCCL